MKRPPPTERLFTPQFIALGVSDLAYFTAVGVSIFALPLYVTGPVGGDEIGAGFAFGVFAVSALVLRPFAGRIVDVYGRLPLLLGGALLAAGSLALIAMAENLVAIIALRLLAGVAEAAFFVAGFAALADLAPAKRLGEALSYNSLRLYLGIALGPPLGEVLVQTWGFGIAWLGAAVLAVLAAALTLLIGETREDTSADSSPDLSPRRFIHRPSIPISIGFITSLVAVGGFLAFASLHAVRVGLSQASLALFVYGGVVVVCRIVFARVPDRLPSLPLGAAALGVIGTGLGLIAVWQAPAGMLVGVVIMAVGVSFCTPAFFSAIFSTATPSQRGAASGTASAALDLGLGLGPIALGLVAGPFGIPWAFGVGAAIAFAGGIWTLFLQRRTRQRQPVDVA
ncbi:MFS transporter [Agromyces albus]|uniref:MFS transporter n=1 Tax=Agromyces albus TaxID=205332 RepID=UPI0027832662|nr:MFS transporter [Agromyces albus]MDQ0575375.1 putative MFS family arabinose efflux permease [Agromyces albus]